MFVANWTSSRCVAYEGSPTGCIYFTVGHVHRHSESWKLSRETPEGRVFVLRASKFMSVDIFVKLVLLT